jgi:hypothetical protein
LTRAEEGKSSTHRVIARATSAVLGKNLAMAATIQEPATELKTCTKCGEAKPYSEYRPNRKGRSGYEARCRDCVQEFKQALKSADDVYFLNREIEKSPDPSPTFRLRAHLTLQRARGQTFSEAWEQSLAYALLGLSEDPKRRCPTTELHSWETALTETRKAWQVAYEGREALTHLECPDD